MFFFCGILFPMEFENIPKPTDYIVPLLAVTGVLITSQFAFSRKSRNEIRRRDGTCQDDSGTSHLGNNEAAHFNHDRSSPSYDDPDNGRLLCTKHHMEDHIDGHGNNGLAKHHNSWAVSMLSKRLGRFLGGKD